MSASVQVLPAQCENFSAGGTRHDQAGTVEPLVPQYVDVATFPWAPVKLGFFDSHPLALLPSAEAFRALILLIAKAWKQVPALTLPSDDRALAAMAGFGRDLAPGEGAPLDIHVFEVARMFTAKAAAVPGLTA